MSSKNEIQGNTKVIFCDLLCAVRPLLEPVSRVEIFACCLQDGIDVSEATNRLIDLPRQISDLVGR